jgi:phage repressor protein C with HTH and peptisase S24 domain
VLKVSGLKLKEAIRIHFPNQQTAADKLGISRQTLSTYFRIGELDDEFIQLVKTNLNIDLKGNIVEKVNNIPVDDNPQNSRIVQAGDISKVDLNFISRLARSSFTESYSDENQEMRKLSIYYNGNIKDLYVIEIGGDSMEDQLQDGQLVLGRLVNRDNWKFTTGVVGVMYNNYFVVKRIKSNDLAKNGTLKLTSDNPRGGEITIDESDLREMWKIEKKLESDVI